MNKNQKNFYVLHYNCETTEHLKDIEFKTYDEALFEYINAKKINDKDVIELIYSPVDTNESNTVLKRKGK